MFGWFRPLRREFWGIIPGWRRAHRFMSTQALGLGTATLTVLIALERYELLLPVLYATGAMVLYGSLVAQPEVEDEHDS